MKTKSRYLVPLILAALVLPWVSISAAHAQAPIYAEVDRTTLSMDETLLLTVAVSASIMNPPAPGLPALSGFNVVGSNTSSRISIVNGDMSSLVVYSYRLQPYETGDLVIEPIHVVLNGQTFSTQAIQVQVTPGTGAPPADPSVPSMQSAGEPAPPAAELTGQDLFVEAEVDNPTPYVGQQVVYTFRFYQAINLFGQPQYQAPTFTGFWNEHQIDQREYRVQAVGRIYQVTEVRTILFPSVLGPVSIDPARLTTPGSLFRAGKTLQTKPVTLDVKPLPPNAPEHFSGAVGQFSLEATIDGTRGQVNEPLTWRVTLNGRGNLTAAADPVWPEVPGWRSFESQATIDTELRDGQMVGRRVYERLLVPGIEGEFTIPSLEYAYFDPRAGGYKTTHTEPIAVSIAPSAAEAPMTPPPGGQKEAVKQIGTDIRHLKPVPHELGSVNHFVTASGLYWAAWVFPVLGAAGYFVWQRRQRYWENNLGLVRSSQARRKAKKALAQARKEKRGAYNAAGLILTTYLADKLNQPVAGLTHHALADLMASQSIKPDLIERVEVCLVSSELGRFAPGADSPDHVSSLLKEVGILVDALERVL